MNQIEQMFSSSETNDMRVRIAFAVETDSLYISAWRKKRRSCRQTRLEVHTVKTSVCRPENVLVGHVMLVSQTAV